MLRRGLRIWIVRVSWCSLRRHSLVPSALLGFDAASYFHLVLYPPAHPSCGAFQSLRHVVVARHIVESGVAGNGDRDWAIGSGIGNWGCTAQHTRNPARG